MTPQVVVEGRYRLEWLAGVGGMGSVYRATDLVHASACAVKLTASGRVTVPTSEPSDPSLSRTATEVQALATIRSESVVRYFAHGVDPVAGPYLVMEWVEGETLRDRHIRAPLTPADALRMGSLLVRALAAVHEAGVVHRDVKPQNVMLSGSPERVTLVDFGVARVGRGLGLTPMGARLGTPRYMAPEQIMNARRVDGRADVFSLGCVVFEMLTGVQAFGTNDEVATLARILIEDAPPIRRFRAELPVEVEELVVRLMARDPRRRPFADEALAREFERLAAVCAAAEIPGIRFRGSASAATMTADGDHLVIEAPSLRNVGPKGRLPYEVGAFLGRTTELDDLDRMTSATGAVVSLWGAVGIGKSRLALELAKRREQRRHETIMVELERATDMESVRSAVAHALGVASGDDEAVKRALGARRAVVVLDGANGALDAANGALERVASGAPVWVRDTTSSLLVVSRARLPGAKSTLELGPVDSSTANALFLQRVEDLGGSVDPAKDATSAVLSSLGGNPLLIELAAARFEALGAEELASRSRQPLEALSGARTADYAFTLEEALSSWWSSLEPAEKRALGCCALFEAPFALASAERVVSRVDRAFVATLAALRDKSLVVRSSA
ncbi:MAG TPA: protein kinase, partial [Labilithrix sp.]|nr:protein kinase [Labilithrix sp.]